VQGQAINCRVKEECVEMRHKVSMIELFEVVFGFLELKETTHWKHSYIYYSKKEY